MSAFVLEAPASRMLAVQITRHGGPEVLTLAQVPTPQPGPGQVLVRVRASCINPRDWLLRQGRYVFRFVLGRFPIIPGSDIAGEVVALGRGVSQWQIGARVFGMQPINGRMGAYAQYVAMSAAALAAMPDNVSFEQAAAVPCAGLTAWDALHSIGKLQPGMRVLINGAAGGVGSYALQLAKAHGAQVVAVCSAANADWARQMGADEVLDYRAGPLQPAGGAVDIYFDAVGRSSLARSQHLLRPGGRYITTIPSLANLQHSLRGALLRCLRPATAKTSHMVLVRAFGANLQAMARLMAAGKLRSEIEQIYPLAEVAQAQQRSQSWHVRGKLVLQLP